MKKEVYKDDKVLLLALNNGNQTDYILNELDFSPQRAMLLPYRNHAGKVEYLVKRALIEGWDAHSDICGIHFATEHDLLESAVQVMADLGYKTLKADVYPLGVVTEGLFSNRSFQLFAVKLPFEPKGNGLMELVGTEVLWVNKDDLLKSVDPSVLSAFARLNEYL